MVYSITKIFYSSARNIEELIMNKGIKGFFVAWVAALGFSILGACISLYEGGDDDEVVVAQTADYTSGMDLFVFGTANYNTYKGDITVGKIYKIYGMNWKVVALSNNVATFLVDEDLTNTYFDYITTPPASLAIGGAVFNGYKNNEVSYNGANTNVGQVYQEVSIASQVE
jgi:hypothetical protein